MKISSGGYTSARFDRAAFQGMALDWTSFGRMTPDDAARDRVALDQAARDAVRRAAAPIPAPRSTDSAPMVARRTAVRGGTVCGRRAPVHRVAIVRSTASKASASVVAAPVVRPARLRLTARGRFVLIVLPVAAVLSGALIGVSGQEAATASTTHSAVAASVVVPSGGSLWSVAERVAPSADPRDVVAAFVRVNDLTGTDVQAGERLTIPTEYAH
jgi:hypothetical protein